MAIEMEMETDGSASYKSFLSAVPYCTQAESRTFITRFLPVSAATSIYLFEPKYAIGSIPSSSGHEIAYRWRSLPRVRHSASSPQVSSSNGCCLCDTINVSVQYNDGELLPDITLLTHVGILLLVGCFWASCSGKCRNFGLVVV